MTLTVAVTGASGHIGNVVCRQLIAKGCKVKALYHSYKESLKGLDLEIMQGNVLNKNDLQRLFTDCDIVINCAAIITIHGDPDGTVFKTNTIGPANVLEVAALTGIKKIIHISSVHAVSELQHDQPFDESRPYKTPADEVYDYSKAIGEQNILKMKGGGNPEVVIIRPSAVLGPFDFKISEMGKALIDFYRGKVPALPEGGFDFVDVRDVAGAIVEAIYKGTDGEIFLITGKYFTMQKLSATLRAVMGFKTPTLVIPYELLRWLLPVIKLFAKITGAAPVFTLSSINTLKFGHPKMSHKKAALKLNYNPRPLEESIRDFYDWARSGHLIN